MKKLIITTTAILAGILHGTSVFAQTLPVVRYTFDSRLTYIEPNAIGADFDARIGRPSRRNAPARTEDGIFGTALRHENISAITSTFPADQSFSLSFWLHVAEPPHGRFYNCEGFFQIDADRNSSELRLHITGTNKTISTALAKGWSCVAVTSDGAKLTLSLNGAPVGELEHTWESSPLDTNAAIGGSFGLLDELRVYDDALTPNQIATISDPQTALDGLPQGKADAGVDHTIYLNAEGRAQVTLRGRFPDDLQADHTWTIDRSPVGAKPKLSTPNQLTSDLTLTAPGDYVLTFTATEPAGTTADQLRITVFPARPEMPPGKLFQNPYQTGTHFPGFRDDEYAYPQEFVDKFLPAVEPKTVTKGYAKDQFRKPPPPYHHPRIYFNQEDLEAIRTRLRYTKAGQTAFTEMQIHHALLSDGQGLPVPYFQRLEGADGTIDNNYTPDRSQQYVNAAFIALVTADSELARTIIDAGIKIAADQLVRIQELYDKYKNTDNGVVGFSAYQNVVGRNATAQIYDYLYPWMTPDEQATFRDVLSRSTRLTTSHGMWTAPSGWGMTNFAPWWTGNLLTNICAIEGEDGFDPVVQKEAMNAMHRFYTYGFQPDGSPGEGMGKNGFSAHILILLAKRGMHALTYENIYNHVAQYLLHTTQPYGNQFLADDLWAGSRGGASASQRTDATVVKFAFPKDPVIDFVYRNAMRDDSYYPGTAYSVHSYSSVILNCIAGLDWSGDPDRQIHADQALANQPTSAHFNYTNLATSRTSWDKDAAYLYFLPRMFGGHPSSGRGTFVYSHLGRDWNVYPFGRNSNSRSHNVITVDGTNAGVEYGKMTAFRDSEERTLFACDLRTLYNDYVLHTANDYRLKPAPEPWADIPFHHLPLWHSGWRPTVNLNSPYDPLIPAVPSPFPAQRAATLVKGDNPYVLIVDEIALDGENHHYRWQLVIPPDLTGHAEQVGRDVILTDPKTGNFLLVRLLNDDPEIEIKIDTDSIMDAVDATERIAFETTRPLAQFEVLLKAFPKGTPIPADNTTFARLGETLAEAHTFFTEERTRFKNEFEAKLATYQKDWGDLGDSLAIEIQLEGNARKAFERVGDTYYLDGETTSQLRIPVASVPPADTEFTISFWFKRETTRTIGNLFNQTGEGVRNNRGINLGYAYNQYLALSCNRTSRAWRDTEQLGQEWDFLAFTYDRDKFLRLFVNGEQKFEVQTHYMDFYNFDSIVGRNFLGWIDDLRITDSILDPKTLLHHYRIYQKDWTEIPQDAGGLGDSFPIEIQLKGNVRKAFERVGDTYYFDGETTSQLCIPVASVPPADTDFTISFWFKRETIRTIGSLFKQTGEGIISNRGINFGWAYNQYLAIACNRNNRAWSDTERLGRDWDFIAFTYDRDKLLRFFVNGEQKFEVRTHYMNFHNFDSSVGSNFLGWIDDFRITDRILDPKTLLQHYRTHRFRDWGRTDQAITALYPTDTTPLSSWRQNNFGTKKNASTAANKADPDNDGLSNLVEYALATNPNTPNQNPTTGEETSDGRFSIIFEQNPQATDIILTVQASTDLLTWSDLAQSTNGNIPAPLIAGVTITPNLPQITTTDYLTIASQNTRFFRIKVTLP